MGVQVSGGYCPHCARSVAVQRQGINHILHLLLSICTCGLWLLVWGYQGFKYRPWRCTRCGTAVRFINT